MYYGLVVFSTVLFCLGMVFGLARPFFRLCLAAVSQLDTLIDRTLEEEEKERIISKKVMKLLQELGLVVLLMVVILVLAALPTYAYVYVTEAAADVSSLYFYGAMVLGSGVLFLLPKGKSDYGYWSRLLHTLVLDNYAIGRFLFKREQKKLKKKEATPQQDFVVVTGLARAGTTALTNLLYATERFHATTYANMPFLMAPRAWRKVYNPKSKAMKARAHGDNLLVGVNSIESMDEYFFKAQLKDAHIHPGKMDCHAIDDDLHAAYLQFQALFQQASGTHYLTKNNNFILRHAALRALNPTYKVVLVFRDPVSHAQSLLNQHHNFLDQQAGDPFVRQYMGWLGHHEFGLDQKVFDFGQPPSWDQYDKTTLNYWLSVWINYYQYVLSLPQDEHLVLLENTDLQERPEVVLSQLEKAFSLTLKVAETKGASRPAKPIDTAGVDTDVLAKANELFEALKAKRLKP